MSSRIAGCSLIESTGRRSSQPGVVVDSEFGFDSELRTTTFSNFIFNLSLEKECEGNINNTLDQQTKVDVPTELVLNNKGPGLEKDEDALLFVIKEMDSGLSVRMPFIDSADLNIFCKYNIDGRCYFLLSCKRRRRAIRGSIRIHFRTCCGSLRFDICYPFHALIRFRVRVQVGCGLECYRWAPVPASPMNWWDIATPQRNGLDCCTGSNGIGLD
jgi:hypothetical protein